MFHWSFSLFYQHTLTPTPSWKQRYPWRRCRCGGRGSDNLFFFTVAAAAVARPRLSCFASRRGTNFLRTSATRHQSFRNLSGAAAADIQPRWTSLRERQLCFHIIMKSETIEDFENVRNNLIASICLRRFVANHAKILLMKEKCLYYLFSISRYKKLLAQSLRD